MSTDKCCGNCKWADFPSPPKRKKSLLDLHGECRWPMPSLPPLAYSIMPWPEARGERYGIWIDTGEMCPVWEPRTTQEVA